MKALNLNNFRYKYISESDTLCHCANIIICVINYYMLHWIPTFLILKRLCLDLHMQSVMRLNEVLTHCYMFVVVPLKLLYWLPFQAVILCFITVPKDNQTYPTGISELHRLCNTNTHPSNIGKYKYFKESKN